MIRNDPQLDASVRRGRVVRRLGVRESEELRGLLLFLGQEIVTSHHMKVSDVNESIPENG